MQKMRGKIHFSYDSDCDVLFSYIKKPLISKSIDMDNGILIHIDPKSKKIAGFSVVNYQRRIRDGILKKLPFFEKLELPSFE